jgi:hypothetical protein
MRLPWDRSKPSQLDLLATEQPALSVESPSKPPMAHAAAPPQEVPSVPIAEPSQLPIGEPLFVPCVVMAVRKCVLNMPDSLRTRAREVVAPASGFGRDSVSPTRCCTGRYREEGHA